MNVYTQDYVVRGDFWYEFCRKVLVPTNTCCAVPGKQRIHEWQRMTARADSPGR
jgi:hypothetical protein